MHLMFYVFSCLELLKKSWCTSEGKIFIGSSFLPLKPDYFNMAAV